MVAAAHASVVVVASTLTTSASAWAWAFVPPPVVGSGRSASLLRPLCASVYYPDEDSPVEEGTDGTGVADAFAFGWPVGGAGMGMGMGMGGVDTSEFFASLAARLSSDPSVVPALARIASAFSPPGFAFDLSHVRDARCLSLDDRHLEIEAVVCDDVECNSLLVPVDLPEACDASAAAAGIAAGGGFEDCVLRNLGRLELAGGEALHEREQVYANEEEARRALEALRSLDSQYLSSSSSEEFPEWWVPPAHAEEADECDLLMGLLNGDPDFQPALRSLAERTLTWQDHDIVAGKTVRAAVVKAVGPAGMVLRARITEEGLTHEDAGGWNNECAADVHISFAEVSPGGGTGGVREEVLAVVSSVNVS